MNILKKTYRKLTSRKYNIGFVENTLEGILQGEPYRIKWMKHGLSLIHIYTGVGSNYMGFLARYGVSLSKWFNVGAQFTPSFNLSHNFEFGYLTSALYLNGNISRDGSWFWCCLLYTS